MLDGFSSSLLPALTAQSMIIFSINLLRKTLANSQTWSASCAPFALLLVLTGNACLLQQKPQLFCAQRWDINQPERKAHSPWLAPIADQHPHNAPTHPCFCSTHHCSKPVGSSSVDCQGSSAQAGPLPCHFPECTGEQLTWHEGKFEPLLAATI